MNDKVELSSGFIGEDFLAEDECGVIEEFYTPDSGYCRLFTCRRYGKLHILKCLKPSYLGQEFYVQLLRKEFDIGYQLEHPHICRTLGWENHEVLGFCILLEYVDGVTLKSFMDDGKLTHVLAYRFVKDICIALQYVHNKQVVHRDLKPENIMITYNGNHVKLIDFGLSDCDDYDILKIPAGTKKYLAPELLDANAKWDCRVDIYSLGVIMFEMATCLKDKHLMRIAQHCTQVQPGKRYGSMQEVQEALGGGRLLVRYKIIAAVVLFFCLILWGSWQYVVPIMKNNVQLSVPVYSNTSISAEEQEERLFIRGRLMKQRRDSIQSSTDSLELWNYLKKRLDTEFPTVDLRKSLGYKKKIVDLQSEMSTLPI